MPYLNLCSLFGNDLEQFSYLDSIKGLTIWFSTSVPYSLPPDFKLLAEKKKKKKNTLILKAKVIAQENRLIKYCPFVGAGGGLVS